MLTLFEGTSPLSRGLTAAQQRTVRAKRVPRTRSLSDGQACGGQSAEMVKGRTMHLTAPLGQVPFPHIPLPRGLGGWTAVFLYQGVPLNAEF